jgi:hypothetical protein
MSIEAEIYLIEEKIERRYDMILQFKEEIAELTTERNALERRLYIEENMETE